MNKKNLKIIFAFSLIIMFTSLSTTIHAKENQTLNIALAKGLEIVKDFDYYEIRTPEEYHEIGKAFNKINEEYLKDLDKDKTYGLEKLLNACYSGLDCKDINMLEVHESFEELIAFSEEFEKKTGKVKRSEVIEEIKNKLGTTEGIIMGYTDKSIKEDQYITRGELGTIVYRIMDKYKVNSDITKAVEIEGTNNHWSKKFVSNEFVSSILNLDKNPNLNGSVTYEELNNLINYLNTFN